ncbi:MAG: type II toxin-antitoxin system VapC family toxin [Pontiella sp.]
MKHKRLFLDTCALVWLVQGSAQLREEVRAAIDEADSVFVSAITAWEISLKAEHGQLELPSDPERWFNEALDAHSLTLYPLSIAVLTNATRLPEVHRDPADRFIIASAIQENCPVVTADGKFSGYDIEIIF